MKELKKELRGLIAENKIEEALDILLEKTDEDSNLHEIAIKLSRRYKSFKEKSLRGLEANEKELSKIVHDTLETVQLMDDPVDFSEETKPITQPKVSELEQGKSQPTPAPVSPDVKTKSSSGNIIKLIIGGLAVAGGITVGTLFLGDDESGFDDTNVSETVDINTSPKGQSDATYETPVADTPPVSIQGEWEQVSQSGGPENDCEGCTINIDQVGGVISIVSSNGWSGRLDYDQTNQEYVGKINWGEVSPNDGEVEATAYLEDGSLIIQTTLGSQNYDMTFSKM